MSGKIQPVSFTFSRILSSFILVVFFFNLYFWTSQKTTFSSTFGSPPFSRRLVDRELTLASGKQTEKKLLLGGAADGWMVQAMFCVPVLIFVWYVGVLLAIAIKCSSMCVTYWHPNTVKTTLHSGQGYSPPTGDPGAVWSPQHSVEPREIVEQHPRRATTSKRCFF